MRRYTGKWTGLIVFFICLGCVVLGLLQILKVRTMTGFFVILLIGFIAALVSHGNLGIFLLITFVLDILWMIANGGEKEKKSTRDIPPMGDDY